ncbi:hypothetical protein Tco_1493596 [Tanacetum coccineum]
METIRRKFLMVLKIDREDYRVKWHKRSCSTEQVFRSFMFLTPNRALLVSGMLAVLFSDQSLWASNLIIHTRVMAELLRSHSSTWSSIVKEINILKTQGIDIISHCKIRVAWTLIKSALCATRWLLLLHSPSRKLERAESLQLTQILDLLGTVILSNIEDRWIWDLYRTVNFSVKDFVSLIQPPTRFNLLEVECWCLLHLV